MTGLKLKAAWVVFLLVVPISLTSAQTNTSASAQQAADALFQAQKWAEAARAYEALAKADPANGRNLYRLGVSRLSLGETERAAAAFEKAVGISNRPEPMYGLASAYARMGSKDKAFEWLDKALNAHLSQPQQIITDPNLASLKDDPRFKEVLVAVERLSNPCAYQEEYKQFDFWVGEWTVTSDGQEVATSSIQRIVKSCIIFENYTQADGFIGKSFNFFDANLHKWRQTWVDATGRASEFVGEYKDGAMRFEGESHLQDGTKVLRRMTLFNLGKDRVRQFSEASTDEGKTWHATYDFIYTRRN